MTPVDLKSPAGVKELDTFLADRSYIEGFQPSQADVVVFNELNNTPALSTPNVLRWYNHMKSFDTNEKKTFPNKQAPAKFTGGSGSAATKNEDDADDVDLFGSDDEEEDAEAARVREERLKAYAAKKSNKPALIAKSSIVLDVKPWDDETDMKEMEAKVRSIIKDGLVWGAAKLVPVGYGINKLQIMCVVEDDKISIEELSEEIQEFEDFVQSVDIAAFNKI